MHTCWNDHSKDKACKTIYNEQYQAFLVNAAAFVPLQVVPTAEQIAEALVWFLEGASVVTGEVLMVDAGLHCGRLPPSSSNKATWDKK